MLLMPISPLSSELVGHGRRSGYVGGVGVGDVGSQRQPAGNRVDIVAWGGVIPANFDVRARAELNQ